MHREVLAAGAHCQPAPRRGTRHHAASQGCRRRCQNPCRARAWDCGRLVAAHGHGVYEWRYGVQDAAGAWDDVSTCSDGQASTRWQNNAPACACTSTAWHVIRDQQKPVCALLPWRVRDQNTQRSSASTLIICLLLKTNNMGICLAWKRPAIASTSCSVQRCVRFA